MEWFRGEESEAFTRDGRVVIGVEGVARGEPDVDAGRVAAGHVGEGPPPGHAVEGGQDLKLPGVQAP